MLADGLEETLGLDESLRAKVSKLLSYLNISEEEARMLYGMEVDYLKHNNAFAIPEFLEWLLVQANQAQKNSHDMEIQKRLCSSLGLDYHVAFSMFQHEQTNMDGAFIPISFTTWLQEKVDLNTISKRKF